MKNPIVVSLFDGISSLMVALNRTGITPKAYFSSEIDKYALEISNKNHDNIIQIGDVRKVKDMIRAGIIGHVDLLAAGSPCQGFSHAGKELAFDHPQSVLFFEFIEVLKLLKEINPNIKFLLENVIYKQHKLNHLIYASSVN